MTTIHHFDLAVTALDNAVARRGDVVGWILHSDRGLQASFVPGNCIVRLLVTRWSGRRARSARADDNANRPHSAHGEQPASAG